MTQRPRRLTLLRVLLLLLGAVMLTAAVMFFMARSEPAHWRQHQRFRQATPIDQREAMAEMFQQRIANTLMNLSELPDGPLTLTVPVQDANAWLELKLPSWLANQNITLPSGVSPPIIATDDEDVVIAFELSTGQITQVISMYLTPRVSEDGRMSVKAHSIKAGRLRVPMDLIFDTLRKHSGQEAGKVDKAARVLDGEPFSARHPIEPNRTCTLIGLDIGPDAVEVTLLLESSAD